MTALDELAVAEFEREAALIALTDLPMPNVGVPVEPWLYVITDVFERLLDAHRRSGAHYDSWRVVRLPGGAQITLTAPFTYGIALDVGTCADLWGAGRLRPWRIRRAIQILRAAAALLAQPWLRSCERVDGKWCCHACRGGPGFAHLEPPRQMYRVPTCTGCLQKVVPIGLALLAPISRV